MELKSPLIKAKLIKRYKRFLADATLEDGSTVTAHCPNTGSMKGFSDPGSIIWLSAANNPKRKLKYTWELYEEKPYGNLIGINTNLTNKIVLEALKLHKIKDLKEYSNIRKEVPYGSNSRIDFLVSDVRGRLCYVEVKNVHLSRSKGLAEFPDAVTSRGKKHLSELKKIVKRGNNAYMLYVIQREDCKKFSLACDIDPDYCNAFYEATAAGVKILCYSCQMSLNEISLSKKIKFDV